MDNDTNPAEPIAEAIGAAIESEIEAAETAEQIAAAALEGERGRRIETLEGDLAECRNLITSLGETLNDLPNLLGAQTLAIVEPLAQRLSAVEDAQNEMTAALVQTLSTPPASEPEPAMTAPEAVEPAPVADESPAPVKKARRFHLM